ncbi:ammonium transporter family protein [Fulvimarina pelagi HTCC2506]|uniref:Ammonium transporter family protein n=1 Tax=Fulvimarina pelagi HTCC2506 TaxID=314231 RepID=Q0G2V0_9HYPH|nr:ammonium transporter [Fulvimarina pelagi]EAU42081.1 ammonium transporter family protein [Fulvimarina pelagi HTCC2506]
MEQQLMELGQKVAALEAGTGMSNTVNMEIFYWWCTALMITIHAGFLAYEMGASRAKNVLASGTKNLLAFAFVVPTFFFFGWWIYNAFPAGLTIAEGSSAAAPWSASMGPNLSDNATGVFWAAFALFAATTASIMSGAVIERIRLTAFLILAIILGSVVWILGGAWGWHPSGWLTTELGYHDVGAAGVVHLIAGAFTLGVLLNLGPRIGKYDENGQPKPIKAHSVPLTVIGLMLIIVGFFGFLGGCIIYMGGAQWTNIYGQPATLSAFAFNTLMSFSGGIIGGWIKTRDPFWMMSCGLVGIISAASGLDVYYPPLAFTIGFVGGYTAPLVARMLERAKIDDAVGAVAVHGFGGAWGVLAMGLFAAGYPNMGEMPPVTLYGQIISLVVLGVLGFAPGYLISLAMKSAGYLRVPHEVEVMGLDLVEVPIEAYPEGMTQPARKETSSTGGIPGAVPAE